MGSVRHYSDRVAYENTEQSLYNDAPGANTDIFDADIRPKRTPAHIQVSVSVSAASKFKVILDDGTTQKTVYLNDGAALLANQDHEETIIIPDNDPRITYNMQVESAVTVDKLIVSEVD